MYLVFDIGGSSTKYACMTNEGKITDRGSFKTPVDNSFQAQKYIDMLAEVYHHYKSHTQIEGIAISMPGQIDAEKGIVYGGGALRYMDKVPLGKLLSEQCDGVKVAMENDAKCAALAEVWLGNASDVQDAFVILIGTGIGGAMIKDRKVHRGKNLLAGEISYLFDGMTRRDLEAIEKYGSFNHNTVEGVWEHFPFVSCVKGSSGALCHRIAKKKNLPDEAVDGRQLYAWAKEGDEMVKEELEDFYFYLATLCINLYVTLNPEVILLGGGISAEPAFLEGVRYYVEKLKKADKVYENCRVDVCKFQNDSNLIGALYHELHL